MTPWVVKMTLLIKRVKMTLYRCQPKRSQNDSFEGVALGQVNDSFEGVIVTLELM